LAIDIDHLKWKIATKPDSDEMSAWLKELLAKEATLEGALGDLLELKMRIFRLREQGKEKPKDSSGSPNDLKSQQELITAAWIKHYKYMEEIYGKHIAQGMAEDAALIQLHDGQRLYEIEQERLKDATIANNYLMFLNKRHEDGNDSLVDLAAERLATIEDTENAQLQRSADTYLKFLGIRQVAGDEDLAKAKQRIKEEADARFGAFSGMTGSFGAMVNSLASMDRARMDDVRDGTEEEKKLAEDKARKSFESAKNLNKGLAVINTGAAIMHALKYGDPVTKWFDVAAVAANGVAQLASISATRFGGGSPAAVTAPSAQGGGGNTQQVSINITGGSFGAGAGDDVINSLRDFFSRDGVLFDGASTQGQVIANG